ncbi:hypothetical protein Goshw_002710, partial [Gossypium schwendimanii]|nr:hypothetical protein [Gossypium schwendimanii]
MLVCTFKVIDDVHCFACKGVLLTLLLLLENAVWDFKIKPRSCYLSVNLNAFVNLWKLRKNRAKGNT